MTYCCNNNFNAFTVRNSTLLTDITHLTTPFLKKERDFTAIPDKQYFVQFLKVRWLQKFNMLIYSDF